MIVSPPRVIVSVNVVGGVRRDLDDEQRRWLLAQLDDIEQALGQLRSTILEDYTVKQRTVGKGVLARDQAYALGAVGPTGRGSGLSQDMRQTGYGACLIRYYDLKKDDLLIVFHNIGYNPCTIDAVEEAKQRGAKIIAVSSSEWQKKLPRDHHIRHPNKKHLFEYADVIIDDMNPYGDADFYVEGFNVPIAPTSRPLPSGADGW